MLIGAFEPAEIGALAKRCAGDEEAHIALLRLRHADWTECDEQTRSDDAILYGLVHVEAPGVVVAENDFTISTIANYLPVRGFAPAVAKIRSYDIATTAQRANASGRVPRK